MLIKQDCFGSKIPMNIIPWEANVKTQAELHRQRKQHCLKVTDEVYESDLQN